MSNCVDENKESADAYFHMIWNEGQFKPQMLLKYRAWHAEDKCMIYDLNSLSTFHGDLIIDDYIVMPCTGLTDKNDMLIYHSDILLLDEPHKQLFGTERNHVLVGFHQGAYMYGRGYDYRYMNTYLWISSYTQKSIQVVGNLYENAELLEMKDYDAKI